MATTSTETILTQLRLRILDFTPQSPLTGSKLYLRLGTTIANARLFFDWAPDKATFPMGIMRLINRFTDGAYNGEREEADLEIMLFANTRAFADDLEVIADICDQAMLRYADSTSGLVFSRRRQRDPLPPPTDPADREIVQIRLLYPLVLWPLFLHAVTT